MFLNVKIKKFMGGSLSHFRHLACWVVEFNYNASVRLIQVINNRNDYSRYF